ncbi:MAG: hypothetical protein HY548_08765 [Elusimicrobia bacterium]|nr:hypothetical protein [Elusimicrobiota bacterium]
MTRPICSIGVDFGGTHLRVQGVDDRGHRVKRFESPSIPMTELPARLKRLWKVWGIVDLGCLAVGSKGVWTAAERRALEKNLEGLAAKIVVMSDVELALESALSPSTALPGKASGILILAGTGSIALGRNREGAVARAGGLGPDKGDRGSGYWIGKEYRLRKTDGKRHGGLTEVRRIAALAKRVVDGASTDTICREIIQEAHTHLADLVLGLTGKLKLPGIVRVSWAGGLFKNRRFLRGFQEELTRKTGKKRIVFIPPRQDPATAAARWGKDFIPLKNPAARR